MKISVVIPAYNEEAVITLTVREVLAYLEQHWPAEHELIVVDDGSTDRTVELIRRFKDIKLLCHDSNRGKGAAVATGVLASLGDWILFMDADNSTRIQELEAFWQLAGPYDIIIGSRAVAGAQVALSQPWYKVALGRLGNLLIQLLLLPGIKDSRCGFKLYSQRVKPLFGALRLTGFSFDDELLFLARRQGFKMIEAPVQWVNNFDSKVRLGDYLATIFDLIKVRLGYLSGKYRL